jgi:3-methyladenine DNA glycosylase AlkD
MKQATNDTVLDTLRREIARNDKPQNRINYQQFFKEKLEHPTGLNAATLRKISADCFKSVRGLPGPDMLALCDKLLASRERYMRFFAFEWALKVKSQYRPQDFKLFESWLKRYVDSWGACDSLCCGPMGYLILQFPELAAKTKAWASSKNRWYRRAAAVSLIMPLRKGLLLAEALGTADRLLTDEDYMVQKGYGWMLKEGTKKFPGEVFAYVMKNKAVMPRTALRYAIEKLPPDMRKRAMAKG